MNENVMLAQQIMEPLTGILIVLILSMVIVTYFYFRNRERQMIIEKGLTPEQINEMFKSKRNPYIWLKLGIITIGTGLGVGFGIIAEEAGMYEGFIPLSIMSFIGLGFVGAFFVARKFEMEDGYIETKKHKELI